jgi:ABC-type transport system substrate-binding protein
MKNKPAFTVILLLLLTGISRPAGEDVLDARIILVSPSDNIFRLKSFSDSFQPQLDPIQADSTIFLSEQMFNGLVTLDSRLNPIPSLAEYWHKDYNGRFHRFILRRGVRFHHASADVDAELTAEDVKFSLERILDPANGSPYASFFLDRVAGARDFYEGRAADVSGFEAVDRYTFVIRWTRPYAMALQLLSMHFCKILPKEEVQKRGEGFFQKPSGTGPFKFRHWVRDNRLNIVGVQMERNPDYFEGQPELEYLEFCPYYSLDDFLRGDVHAIPVATERLLQMDFQIIRDGSIFPFFLGMSCHLPPFQDPIMRRAIATGIDKSELVRATYDVRYHRQLLHSFIPPKLPGFFLTDDINTFNPEQARILMEEAGFPADASKPPLTLLMEYPRTEFSHRFYLELRRQLEALGFELREWYYRDTAEVKEFSHPYLILSGKRLNFPGPEDIIEPLFATGAEWNLCRYSNAELDGLLKEAEVEKSWKERNRLFLRIQRILNSEMPAVPLFSQQNQVALQPFVSGMKNPPLGFYYVKMKDVRILR